MGAGALKVFLDTHTAVFLWEGRKDVWGEEGKRLLETMPLVYSPMVDLELSFLFEIGKLVVEPLVIIRSLRDDFALAQAGDPFGRVVSRAAALSWTRDPFDRLITAHAMVQGAPLVTRDRIIRANYPKAVW